MIIILTFFMVVRVLEAAGLLHPLAGSFADDLLCLPLVLGTILWAHRKILGRGSAFTLPRSHGLLTLILFAVYFEAVLPFWQPNAVSDPWDLLMYLLGYLYFEKMINAPKALVSEELHQEPAGQF